MNEIAWKIINGLCSSIGIGFFFWFVFCSFTSNELIKMSVVAISGVLLALLVGRILFGG